ncbi:MULTISPECIES: response regulator transcription factor [Microbulbifer]|uniref:response regulator n=1 Tax=Microbulbifer TaxID=48073 RepID=UPI001E4C39EF|nr:MULTISPECIES: response regulator transcription factor [Microbulbifer]UHQ56691.1 response regulator transcription factor [Microbulbifer sp. YPW16]
MQKHPFPNDNARRILLVDDHSLLRAGMRALLDDMTGIAVIGESGDGLEALEMIRKDPPDAVLLDVSLPGMNGLEVAAHLSQHYPDVRILILSMHSGAEYVARALNAGAQGYLLKDSAFDELAEALKALFAGRDYLCAAIDRAVVERFVATGGDAISAAEVLTPRQRQILQLIAEGRGPREIADSLNVSVKTVEAHRAQLMDRLGIHNVPGLVRFAIRTGLVNPEP